MKKILFFCLFPILSIAQTQIGLDINGEAIEDQSGYSVALSANGTTLAIGAPFNDGNGIDSGHVRVYQNNAGAWTQVGTDINGETVEDFSGWSVALSANGAILAIGTPYNNGNGYQSGHVRVYQNNAGTWTQIGADIKGEAAGDFSGWGVALSDNGAILAISALYNDGNGDNSGHVRVYQNNAGTWTQVGADIDGEATTDESGYSMALSANGATLAIGAPQNNGNGENSGHVRVYQNNAGTWTQVGADINGEAIYDSSFRVALSANGTTLAIGAPQNSGNGSGSGYVRVYQNNAGTWTQIGTDINGAVAGDITGYSVALSDNGATLAIGVPYNFVNGSFPGKVRVYQYNAGTWTQAGVDINGEAAGDFSGYNIALSANGATLAIGAPTNDGNGNSSGHVRVYDLSMVLASNTFVLANFSVYPNPTSEKVTITLLENLQLERVNIYTALGQLVKTEKNNVIYVNALAKGSYFFEVITNKGKATKTIVIQ